LVVLVWPIPARQADRGEVPGLVLALLAVELQPARVPGAEHIAADVVLRLGEVAAAGLHATLGEGERIAALLGQAIGAEPAEQYVVRALILGVKFEAIAFE